jgi:putative flippase GtrA
MRAVTELKQVLRFGLTAGLATGVHLSIAEILILSGSLPTSFEANIVAFVPAVIVSYWAQRCFTFRSQGSVSRFFTLAVAGFALNNFVLLGVSMHGVPGPIGLLVSGLASPALSYVGCRQLVFAQKEKARG